MSESLLSKLKLDNWYKVVLAVAAPILVLSLTVELMAPNLVVQLLSAGAILVGVGEWINHVPTTTINAHYRITVRNRENTILGNSLSIAGLVVIAIGVFFAVV